MAKYVLGFAAIFLFSLSIFLFAYSQSSFAQTVPTPTIFQYTSKQVLQSAVTPSYYPLAPCPSCTDPSLPPLGGSNAPSMPSSTITSPAPSIDPCTPSTTSLAHEKHKKKGKHWKHDGGLSRGMEALIELLIKLINKIIELFGGTPLENPQTPVMPDEEEEKEDPEAPQEPEQPENPQVPSPDPCAPTSGPSVPAPSQTVPSTTQPSIVPSTSQVSGTPSMSPQPSGATADACVAPAGLQLQDQDTSDSQLAWKRAPGQKAVINFETKNAVGEFKSYMEYAAGVWNKSPCLDVKLVDTCQSGTNCVTVKAPDASCGADGNFDAVESGGFTTAGHICVKDGLSAGESKNVMIHEMGHGVGLSHRKTERVLMNTATYEDVFDPDPIEYQNLLVRYGNQK